MTRLLAAVAVVAGLLASAAPAATACDLEHCPGTSLVCGPVVDCTPRVVGCVPVGDWAYVCL
jgi:hypothetical protein